MRNAFESQIAEILADAKPFWSGTANEAELAFVKLIQAAEGIPMNSGWSDFAVFGKDNRLKAIVEVKPEEGKRGRWKIRSDQLVMLVGLASFGIPCFIWSSAGLIQINQDGTAKPVRMEALTGIL